MQPSGSRYVVSSSCGASPYLLFAHTRARAAFLFPRQWDPTSNRRKVDRWGHDSSVVAESKDEWLQSKSPKWAEPYLANDPEGWATEGSWPSIVEDVCAQYRSASIRRTTVRGEMDLRAWISSLAMKRLSNASRVVSVLSSRLHRPWGRHDDWFKALRAVALQASLHDATVLSARGTTAHRFLCRLTKHLGVSLVTIEKMRPGQKLASLKEGPGIWVGPSESKPQAKLPAGTMDRLLAGMASDLIVLHANKKGNVAAAVEQRLNFSKGCSRQTTRILVNSSSAEQHDHWLAKGAEAWHLLTEDDGDVAPADNQPEWPPAFESPSPVLSLSEVEDIPFLIHWTRAQRGPWPDQSQDEYLDDLIYNRGERERTPACSLSRILQMQRIKATSTLTRDATPVVCFCEMTLNAFRARRIFRPHLSRWDFEHFGIAFDREWLLAKGCKPVVYGDQQTWQGMERHLRPWFQATGKRGAWSQENEWRICGDLALGDVPSDAALVFVANREDVPAVAACSRWPVVVLTDGGE